MKTAHAGSPETTRLRATAEASPNFPSPEKIPSQFEWHYRTLLRLRQRLLAAPPGEPRLPATAEPHCGENLDTDGADDHNERWAELGLEDNGLYEVDCALQRIRDGVYGFCEETGRPIPADRLRATPWIRYHRAEAGNSAQPIHEGAGPNN